jgi:hypothetical protein
VKHVSLQQDVGPGDLVQVRPDAGPHGGRIVVVTQVSRDDVLGYLANGEGLGAIIIERGDYTRVGRIEWAPRPATARA